jgi:sulfite exporter TauE/SafE
MIPALVGPLVMGLAGSGHCGGMCGGIAASAAASSNARPGGRALLPVLLNGGRLVTYVTAGAVVGALGGALGDVTALHDTLAWVRGVAGVALVAFGLALAAGVRSFTLLDRLGGPLWRSLQPLVARVGGPSTPLRALAFGALWGFLPCGLVYTALALSAAAGSAAAGAASMAAFGLGTTPALVLVGSLTGSLRAALTRPAVRLAVGLAVVFSGVVNLATVCPELYGVRLLASTTHACCRTSHTR